MLEDDQKVGVRVFVRPLFHLIFAPIWFLFLVRFMSNLGDLGSNYLPSIHIVRKLHFVFISGEIIVFRWKRGLQKWVQVRIEDQGNDEHQEEQNGGQHPRNRQDTGEQLGARAMHPRGHPGLASNVARPCQVCHGAGCSGLRFSAFYTRFSFIFWGPLLDLFESILG